LCHFTDIKLTDKALTMEMMVKVDGATPITAKKLHINVFY
jgi:hypothetical protein